MKSNGTEGREAKTLITFKLNNPSIVLASLGPLHDALLTPGDNWTRVICSWFLQAPWAPLPAMGILKSRQADLKAVFTALPIPTAVLLVYMATAEIPRIVWYAKWRDFQLLETQCILFELQGRLQNAVTLAYIFPGNSREQRTKESILRYMIFYSISIWPWEKGEMSLIENLWIIGLQRNRIPKHQGKDRVTEGLYYWTKKFANPINNGKLCKFLSNKLK